MGSFVLLLSWAYPQITQSRDKKNIMTEAIAMKKKSYDPSPSQCSWLISFPTSYMYLGCFKGIYDCYKQKNKSKNKKQYD